MIRRHITRRILEALADTPVVFLQGARRTGKSTLARHIAATTHPARYVTLDDLAVLATARRDPMGFVTAWGGPVVLDEVQRAPDLLLAVKAAVDRDPVPGRFLLTGSANVLLLPRIAESLAGRVELITLFPCSQAELQGQESSFVDTVFTTGALALKGAPEDPARTIRRALVGGYPEVVQRDSDRRRRAWFTSYLSTTLQRDVRDLARIEGLTALPQLLGHLATRSASLLNRADLSRDAGMVRATLDRYLALLQAVFLVDFVPAWTANIGKRLVKAPKALLGDSGLLAHLLGLRTADLGATQLGRVMETFAANEVQRQLPLSEAEPRLYHFRSRTEHEVDMVLDAPGQGLVGIEVKSSATVHPRDVAGLRALREATGSRFVRGVVLYLGAEVIPYAENIHAVPMTALWEA